LSGFSCIRLLSTAFRGQSLSVNAESDKRRNILSRLALSPPHVEKGEVVKHSASIPTGARLSVLDEPVCEDERGRSWGVLTSVCRGDNEECLRKEKREEREEKSKTEHEGRRGIGGGIRVLSDRRCGAAMGV
jgi:hypothetical protein